MYNQDKVKKPFSQAKNLKFLAVELEFRKLQKKSPKKIAIVNEFLRIANFYDEVYPAQGLIAKRAKCSREWVNKLVKLLVRLGLVKKTYLHRRSCTYIFDEIFKHPLFRWRLRDVFSAFRFIPKSLLMPLTISQVSAAHNEKLLQPRQFTPIINTGIIYKKEEQSNVNTQSTLERDSLRKVYKEASSLQIEKITNKFTDNLNKADPPPPKNKLLEDIDNRKRLIATLEIAFAKSRHYRTGEMLDKAKRELANLERMLE